MADAFDLVSIAPDNQKRTTTSKTVNEPPPWRQSQPVMGK
jgi:hypothetical protein